MIDGHVDTMRQLLHSHNLGVEDVSLHITYLTRFNKSAIQGTPQMAVD